MNTINNPTSHTDLPQGTYGSETDASSSTLRDRLEDAKMKCGDLYEGAREKVTAGARSTDLVIRNNPYAALGLALGVGVLVGMLIGRASKGSGDTYTGQGY